MDRFIVEAEKFGRTTNWIVRDTLTDEVKYRTVDKKDAERVARAANNG